MVRHAAVPHGDRMTTTLAPAPPPPPNGAHPKPRRDPAVDLLRAGAMLVVVAWHWVFTIVTWRADGPHVDNPISFFGSLAPLSWVLQVVPVFFLVGGYVTARATSGLTTTSERWDWVRRRVDRLGRPALPVIAVLAVAHVAAHLAGFPTVAAAMVLTATPLWFLVAYLAITALVPAVAPIARRWPVGHVVVLAATCVAWDVLRFQGVIAGGWRWWSMVLVWLAVHQLGGLLDDVADRRRALALAAAGLGTLVAATTFGPYPVSMVGTTTDAISNMGPATAVIIALASFQLALVALARPALDRLAVAHRPVVERLTGLAMPVYLWHMVGYGTCVLVAVALGATLPARPDVGWWLTRPLWVVAPLLVTWPLVRRTSPG
jgi:peptidoglycan/LPS O-acetylase OafA/YrhL